MVRNTFEVQNVGDLLREKRRQLGKDIKDVSDETKIRVEYLIALEAGNYEKFASNVYAKGFLKKYAKYLGISPERASALYRREQLDQDRGKVTDTKFLSQNRQLNFLFLDAGRLFSILILAGLLVGVAFFLSQVSNVVKPPFLSFSLPLVAENPGNFRYETTLEVLSFKGIIEPGTKLFLNSVEVEIGALRSFEIPNLKIEIGENSFNLVAKNQFAQETEFNFEVIRNLSIPAETENQLPENPAEPIDLTVISTILRVSRESFFQISIDGQPLLSQVLEAETLRSFEAKELFEINTTSENSATLQIDDQIIDLARNKNYKISRNLQGIIQILDN